MLLAIALVGRAAAQQGSPFELPTPLGGPIRSPSGQIINGIESRPRLGTSASSAGLSGSSGNVDIFKAVVDGDVRYDDVHNVFRAEWTVYPDAIRGWTIEQKGFLTARDEIPVLIGYRIMRKVSSNTTNFARSTGGSPATTASHTLH